MGRRRRGLLVALIALGALAGVLALPASAALAQQPGVPVLPRVMLADGRTHEFARAGLERLPAAPTRLRDGAPFTVPGVSVTALLRSGGLDLAANLGGGQGVGHALIARGADGSRAVFGLAEVDPHFGHAPVMVSWANAAAAALPARVGPMQLIATGESRPGRWVRQLIALEVKALP